MKIGTNAFAKHGDASCCGAEQRKIDLEGDTGMCRTRTQVFKQLAKTFQILQSVNDAIRTGASSSRTHFVRLRTKLALLIYFTAHQVV